MKLVGLLAVVIALAVSFWLTRGGVPKAKLEVLQHGVGLSDDEKDEAVLTQLRQHGSDLTKPTNVVFYLYIPTREHAQAAAAELRRTGYIPEMGAPLGQLPNGEYESRYSVVAHVEEVPSVQNIKKARRLYTDLAHRYNGEYDGWEAAVTPLR